MVDVIKWRKYSAWLTSLTDLGYNYQALYWNSQFFGVPQSRDRVYLTFWLRDLPAPDLEYHPTAFCEYCEQSVLSVQSWKKLLKWGSYQEQYTYNCPRCTREVTPHFTPARSILNLNNLGRPIGGRLVENIQANIAKGIERLPKQPFLYGYYSNPVYRHLDEPIGTITTVDRWALISPTPRLQDTLHRMLSVQEVKLAMGFSADYHPLGTAKEQIWQLGNAVCPPVMVSLLKRCLAILTSPITQKVA